MILIALVLSAAILFLAQIVQPHPQDVHTFYIWMQLAFERGIFHIYEWTPEEVLLRFKDFSPNYPPFIFSLYPLAWVLHHFNLWPSWPSVGANLFFRIPIVLIQLFLCYRIYQSLKKQVPYLSRKWALLLLFLNPAFIVAGPIWGQLNFLLWGTLTLSCLAWEDHKSVSSALWAALGATIKPQFVMFLPLLAFLMVKKREFKFIIQWFSVFASGVILYCSPFILTSGFDCLAKGYVRLTGGQYGIADIGYNFWWTLFHGLSLRAATHSIRGIPYSLIATVLGNGLVALAGYFFCFRSSTMNWLKLATLSLLILFCFLPGMNPQCLVFGVAFLCLRAIQVHRLRPIALLMSAIQCVNLAFNAVWTPNTRFYLSLPVSVGKTLGVACFIGIMVALVLVTLDQEDQTLAS
jgi:Gpi18-like mannosyltransferase